MAVRRHKMSLDIDYVKDWTVQDALRELFQNAIDHGKWKWEFKQGQRMLTITSMDAELSTSSLLLGHSRKKDGAIGKFGEGYKLAMLVLCRLGHPCWISTGTELWQPKLINSRIYKTQQLVFDVRNEQPPIDDIQFIIHGIDNEIFNDLMDRNLHVREPSVGWQTRMGHILPEAYAGKVFVKGLWVCDIEGMKHGYDFKPEHITLDRDRRVVRDFDLQWRTCQMWQETEEFDYILELIKTEAPDVKYLDSFDYSHKQGLADKAADAFIDEHGQDAIPVTCQSDIERAKDEGHEKIVMVPQVTKQLLSRSGSWHYPAPRIVRKTPRELLLDYARKWRGLMIEGDMQTEFDELIEKAERWSA